MTVKLCLETIVCNINDFVVITLRIQTKSLCMFTNVVLKSKPDITLNELCYIILNIKSPSYGSLLTTTSIC